MKIAIGNDHRGYILKRQLMLYLKEQGYEVFDMGCDSEDSVDYPIYAKAVCKSVKENCDFGVLICGTGIGMSIAANKIKGIRCAKVTTKEEAILTRIDNDSNVIALSYKILRDEAFDIVKTFIETETSVEERHIRRRKMLEDLENES